MNPDRLAELEEERRFLLRSLADLQRERDAGDVDEHDYQTLNDGYTARAAVVLRAIEEGHAALPAKASGRPRRVIATVLGVIVVAVLAGWLVARSSGQRLDGESITGGSSPDRITVLLSQARAAMGSDVSAASTLYLQVLDLDPANAEARTYTGWLLAISTQGKSAEEAAPTLAAAKDYLNKAIASDPTYPDPHCLLAVVNGRFENDPAAAKVAAEDCLANNPPAQMRGMIEAFVDGLDPANTTPTSG